MTNAQLIRNFSPATYPFADRYAKLATHLREMTDLADCEGKSLRWVFSMAPYVIVPNGIGNAMGLAATAAMLAEGEQAKNAGETPPQAAMRWLGLNPELAVKLFNAEGSTVDKGEITSDMAASVIARCAAFATTRYRGGYRDELTPGMVTEAWRMVTSGEPEPIHRLDLMLVGADYEVGWSDTDAEWDDKIPYMTAEQLQRKVLDIAHAQGWKLMHLDEVLFSIHDEADLELNPDDEPLREGRMQVSYSFSFDT